MKLFLIIIVNNVQVLTFCYFSYTYRCRNRDFATIIPHQPAKYRERHNEVFLDFEAFLLSTMKERSTLWIHSQIKACMDANDCQPVRHPTLSDWLYSVSISEANFETFIHFMPYNVHANVCRFPMFLMWQRIRIYFSNYMLQNNQVDSSHPKSYDTLTCLGMKNIKNKYLKKSNWKVQGKNPKVLNFIILIRFKFIKI